MTLGAAPNPPPRPFLLPRSLPLLLLLIACSPLPTEWTDRRTEPNTSGPTPDEDPVEVKSSKKPTRTPSRNRRTKPATPEANALYEDSLDLTAPVFYYQSEPSLADLFAPNGQSQLCWPTAMSYTLESLRTYHEPPFAKLERPRVRDLYERCGTDRKTGTTMPQGVNCVDSVLKDSGYEADLSVVGVDAKWKRFGLYPESVVTSDESVSTEFLRDGLFDGKSLIMFIGYYKLDTETGTWSRLRGHFVSVTGFGDDEDDDWIDLHLVNPAVDYLEEDPERGSLESDIVRMSPIEDAEGLPLRVTFQLSGPHFQMGEGTLAAVESVLQIVVK